MQQIKKRSLILPKVCLSNKTIDNNAATTTKTATQFMPTPPKKFDNVCQAITTTDKINPLIIIRKC